MKKMLCLLFTFAASAYLHAGNINWSTPPTLISTVSINASSAQVAIDANGDAVAVWVENNFVKASSKPVSGSWSSEVTISSTVASSPVVVMDLIGNATAVWVENGVVKAATKTLAGSWSASTALSDNRATSPTLCVDGAGDVIAAWVRNNNIETSTKLFGQNWGGRSTINGNTPSTPEIAVGGSGANIRAVIVWHGVLNGTNVIYASTKSPISGNWTSSVLISETTHNATQPEVAVDSNGNAIAIWYSFDTVGNSYTNVVVKSAERSVATGTWSAVSSLSAPGIRNPSTLQASVAFDNFGNAIALWNTSFDDETFNLESAIKPVNGNWSAPVDLVSTNLYVYTSGLATTSFGDVLSLYMFYNGSALQIQSIESDINGYLNNFWSVPITISTGSDNAFPVIAASLNGNVIHAAAVWQNFNGSFNSIVALTGSKTLPLPPTALAVVQSFHNFGVFTEYYNTLSWTASTDPSVVGYLIFRNGQFLEQVGASTTHFVDDNRALLGSVTYSVTAINAQNTQSTTVSVNYP